MILEKNIDYNEMQRLGFSKMFNVKTIKEAVLNEDKDALRELIFDTVEKLNKEDIHIEKQILELHFDEESRGCVCCMIYDVLDNKDGASEGRYLKLNNEQILFIRKYIDENMLDFII